jgi:hypothetical protein
MTRTSRNFRYGAWAGIAIDGSERPLWVDGGLSCIVQKLAAVGGLPTFAGTCSGDKVVALIAILAS